MKRLALVTTVLLTFSSPAYARDHDGECSKQSCEQHSHNGDNMHFERIGPVYICVQPGSCTTDGGSKPK
jgi:hypothetical protein